MIDVLQLHGFSYPKAELYGKPHIGAFYAGASPKTNCIDENARCVVCGRLACNSHHVAPLGQGKSFTLNTEFGDFVLHSPLFAVCGSGTTGCHNEFHGGARYFVTWEWESEQYRDEWWNGHILAHVCPPHSEFLCQMGHYVLFDRKTCKERVICGN